MGQLIHFILQPFFFILLLTTFSCSSTETYKNPKLPVEERVEDLISRMTLEEKIRQMIDYADSVPRLGIPEYNWWNEGLHGVARSGIATVFPQAIGLAATFNDSLMVQIATVISDEFRAKYNDYIKKNERDRYKGLTVWSPNINIFRDPRWGRGQETYGEDPFLTARMGVAFVRGMQGNDPMYYKTIATPKHYVVHSGPEPLRHEFDADVSQRDFMDTYLPAFKACIIEGNAQSVMSAYNRFRGESCTGSNYLLTDILRDHWGFDGYVVSDCGAVYDIFANHKLAGSEAEAAAIAVKAGCDLNCGRTYSELKTAIDSGYLTEADIDLALKRLFKARFQLGMFDPPEMVPYNKIPYEVNDCKAHRRLSVEAAKESIVLLKNENKLLPLGSDIKTIAVIGPNADNPEVMYGNYNGLPSAFVTPLEGIRRKVPSDVRILYSKGCSYHQDYMEKEVISRKYLSSEGQAGLTGEYFTNPNLEGTPYKVRIDSAINFSWFNRAPLHGMNPENYSMRWHGNITAPIAGRYLIAVNGDDGFRLFIDDQLLINAWYNGWKSEIVYLMFEAGSQHSIKIEYYQNDWYSHISLEWALPSDYNETDAIDMANQSDIIVFVGGLSPRLEGEEMEVDLSGFKGGDRVSLDLPSIQTDMLKKLKALGKPIVLVLMNGSALSINWSHENIPAILETWYPGQEGGTAIAEVLFGDYNPAGRLPLTFYKSVDQLPPFEDYAMNGRTYRYFNDEPLYGFGFGLSYTEFKYSDLDLPEQITTTEDFQIKVTVLNAGEFDGDEVIQLYIKHLNFKYPVPIHALKGFKRIHLKAGEQKTVSFTLAPEQLSVIDDTNQRIVLPGAMQVFVGGQQPNRQGLTNGQILTAGIQMTGKPNVLDKLD
ncbi:MAG: glycoside hydrolase family 3 C-terminal domain-containing protein [Bacteroidales bacterium]|nr:glycoside hydrolase family 3 C-terminal domain-containing protein [Bacteroidales bacterium]